MEPIIAGTLIAIFISVAISAFVCGMIVTVGINAHLKDHHKKEQPDD